MIRVESKIFHNMTPTNRACLRRCGAQLGTISVGPGSQSTCTKVCRIGRGAQLGVIGPIGLILVLVTHILLRVLDKSRVDYTLARDPLRRGAQLGANGPIGLRSALPTKYIFRCLSQMIALQQNVSNCQNTPTVLTLRWRIFLQNV